MSKSSPSEKKEASDVTLIDSSNSNDDFSKLGNTCVGCEEDNRLTKKKEEWLQCLFCICKQVVVAQKLHKFC